MDRTREFLSLVSSFQSQPNFVRDPAPQTPPTIPQSFVTFDQRSKQINKMLQTAAQKIGYYKTLLSQKSSITDSTQSLDTISSSIKSDISMISSSIKSIDAQTKNKEWSPIMLNHAKAVIQILNKRLTPILSSFQECVKKQTTELQRAQERTQEVMDMSGPKVTRRRAKGILSDRRPDLVPQDSSDEPIQFNPTYPTNQNQPNVFMHNSFGDEPFQTPEELLGASDFQPLITERREQQRSTTLQTAHRTLNEISQMFQNMGRLLAQQRDNLQLIDYNLDHANVNMDMSIDQLEKARSKQKNRRKRIIQILLVIFVVVLLIGLLVR
ncbi:Syntaxin 5 [Blattamonas nauphoetae]|uniref:Syntaxin 5 n=1 Tax=Blattamonas nauphoetae TaxID=2049346 RepID=A0ABQ9Y4H9_9EUKA|nr:Syntaxin 5 [Blattamonas nauphoetae]